MPWCALLLGAVLLAARPASALGGSDPRHRELVRQARTNETAADRLHRCAVVRAR